MIEVEALTKNYGPVAALRGITFQVGRGEIVGFVGPNGAGKSTTLRILAGFIGPSSGSVKIAGFDLLEEPMRARQSLGYMPETAPLYPELRVSEYLRFRARLKRVPAKKQAGAVAKSMEQAGLSHVANTLIGQLSKGYRQRVGLADALVADPPLLMLDEPTAGLDPNQIREVRRLLKELGETHTVLLSTHILSEVEATCDRALVIHQGELVLTGALSELREERVHATLSLNDPEARALEILKAASGVREVEQVERRGSQAEFRMHVAEQDPIPVLEAAVRALVQAGIGVFGVKQERRRLEDVFSQLTEGAHEEATKS